MASLLAEVDRHLTPATVDEISRELGADPRQTTQAIAAAVPMLVGGLSRNTLRDPRGAQSLDDALQRDHDGGMLDALDGMFGGGSSGGGGVLGGILGGVLGGDRGGDPRSSPGHRPSDQGGGLGGMVDSVLGGLGRDERSDRPPPRDMRDDRRPSATGRAPSASGGLSELIRGQDGEGILGHIFGPRRSTVKSGVGKASGLDTGQVGRLMAMLAPIVMAALGRMKRTQGLGPSQLTEVLDQDRRSLERALPDGHEGDLLKLLDHDDEADEEGAAARIGNVLGMFRA